jgi:ankyrin repeat protein
MCGLVSTAQSPSASLVTAIRNNDLAALRQLAKADTVNVPDRGRTPLMIAAGTGTIDAMRILISAGADVNAGDTSGATPLMYGVRDIDKVRLLLEKGARANDKSRQGTKHADHRGLYRRLHRNGSFAGFKRS